MVLSFRHNVPMLIPAILTTFSLSFAHRGISFLDNIADDA